MGQVLIRNLDDVLIADYKRAAADHGRSLEAELRAVLAERRPLRRLTQQEKLALSHSLTSLTPLGTRMSDSTDLIREDRDSR